MKMMKEIDRKHSWRKLSPDDGHFFFGYYDRNPWDGEIRRHLVLKIPQIVYGFRFLTWEAAGCSLPTVQNT